ncbi:hypothetical protein AVEN_80331-1 [Araneus ventricosus]|uniref:Uncharacterized protein n=1 Tax=Araneus ventricosus TaxID=182803 RepID=A0A4Y2TVG8_ARAVE|nr:hypothetical protein AVEN_33706-1 [Araneus ventricosus]GBO03420.1 hypothetical protein AVEN_80331-1 [Araneus ventricosus]
MAAQDCAYNCYDSDGFMDFNQDGTDRNLFTVGKARTIQSLKDYSSSNQLTAQSTAKTQNNTPQNVLNTRLKCSSLVTDDHMLHSLDQIKIATELVRGLQGGFIYFRETAELSRKR